jgi:hypothetical protein
VSACTLGLRQADPFVRHPFEDFPGQVVTGVVSIRGACAGIELEPGGWSALLWPANAQPVDGPGAPTLLISGQRVAVGAEVRLGGGWVEGGSAYFDYIRDARVIDICPSTRYFMVSEVVTDPDQ